MSMLLLADRHIQNVTSRPRAYLLIARKIADGRERARLLVNARDDQPRDNRCSVCREACGNKLARYFWAWARFSETSFSATF